jgi:hypothetical protein
MRILTIFFVFMGLLSACREANKTDNIKIVPLITIDGYELLDTNSNLLLSYSEKEIIQLKCSTNLPLGCRLIIRKGMEDDRTSNEADNDSKTDTVFVSNPQFTVAFTPKHLGGYVNFFLLPDLQPDSVISKLTARATGGKLAYAAEYRINMIKKQGNNNLPMPAEPVKLNIEKVK